MRDIPEIKRRGADRCMARLRCEAVSADGFVAVGGTLRDLSATGMLLEASQRLRPGEELYLSFQAPRTTQWIGLVARVERTIRLLDGARCLAGLSIEEIDPIERSILVASLAHLPRVSKKRRAPRDYAAWVADVAGLSPALALATP